MGGRGLEMERYNMKCNGTVLNQGELRKAISDVGNRERLGVGSELEK